MDWTPTITGRTGPLYERIVSALADDIAAGRLHHGQLLPTHRALAAHLGVDLTTVTRAFREAKRLGLVEARVGRGTFVAAPLPASTAPAALGIDLSMNLPPQPERADLPAHLLAAISEFRSEGRLGAYLSYQLAGGTPSERAVAARWLEPLLPGVAADRLIVAPGSQAVLFALLLELAQPGGTVLTEALTYPGLKAAAASLGIRLVGIEMDGEGARPEALDQAAERTGARVAVLTPTLHNPTTATMSPARRSAIADVVRARGLTLIEDDPYAFLLPGIRSIAHVAPASTYLAATLSKCIAPGLRTSLVVAPDGVRAARLATLLRAAIQMPAPLMTAVAVRWLRDGTAATIVEAIRTEAAARLALAREILAGHDVEAQNGGYHLWLRLPERWPRAAFAESVRGRGLAIVTSDAFAVDVAPNAIRVALGAAANRTELKRALHILRDTLATPPQDEIV